MGSKELCIALCLTTVIVLDDAGMSREEQDEMLRPLYSWLPVGAGMDDVNLN
jgi:hypothetical protein